ncbi:MULTISPECIES: MFS transporter [Catenuloplanes]|uniref:MFS family permease n=1 Tax=Catenuloplanes niger TaxID=587534 RepID=A0AAE4CVQ7_9ACTN|nr:MFS transporter [Catenuloplanes niger]MDR7325692.1 MFS family permease [Catenuloplanes niger]
MTLLASRGGLLREPVFRTYWSAHVVSLVGEQISYIALPLLAVLTVGAGPAEMGYLTAAALIPNLLFSLAAGAWVDRRPIKRHIMIGADLARAGLLLVVPVLAFAGLLELWHLYAIAFLTGTLTLFFEVANNSLFASVVRRSDYIRANSLLNGARAMSYVAGPSAGGLLVQAITAPFALIADAVSYLGSALLLLRIRPDESAAVSTAEESGVLSGLRFIARSAVLRSLLLGVTVLNLFNYVYHALFILYATTALGLSAGQLGVLIGVASIGGVLGATVTGPLIRRIGVGPVAIAGFVFFPLPLVLVPLAAGGEPTIMAMVFAAEFLSSIGLMMLDIAVGSLQTAATPMTRLSLVSGAKRTVNYGVRPLGALLGGFLGETIGVHPTIWIASVGAVTGTVFVLFSPIPRLRDLPEQPD